MEAWLVILHFEFNSEDVSVWPRGKREGWATKELCDPHRRTELRKWSDKYIKPTRVACEKVEIAK